MKELWGGEPPHLLSMKLISHGIQSNPSYALWNQIEAPSCGEPWVTEVLSGCVLLTWAWPCQESHSFKLRGMAKPSSRDQMCWQWVQRMSITAFSSQILQPRDCLLTKTVPTEISGTCFLDPAVLYKPCLLVPVYNNPFFLFQWYAMALPLCSTLFNKHTELPDGWGFSIALTIQSPLSDYVCSCLSFLYHLLAPVKSIPGAM